MIDAEQAVLAANERFYAVFNARDMAGMDNAWAEDSEVVCIHPGWNILRGRQAVLESWAGILGNPGQPRIVTGGATAVVHGSMAVVTCRELVGGSPLAATNVFVLEEGEWRLVHHHSGPVAAQAMA